jgi:hypothetical protein
MDIIPMEIASLATFSAAIVAAYDVLLRDPLNPEVPAVAQAITFPNLSATDM